MPFGLKKPFSVFCPAAEEVGVVVDLERLAGGMGAGCERLRGRDFVAGLSGTGGALSVSKDADNGAAGGAVS